MRNSHVAGVCVAALLCTSCGGGTELAPHDGPLSLGGESSGTICVNAGKTLEYTYAFDSVGNSTDAEIQVDRVVLIGAKNASAIGGYLAPIEDQTLIGAIPGWPPEGDPPTFEMKKAIPTALAAGENANLVVHLKATSPAQVEAFEVTYTSGGDTKRVWNTTRFQVRDVCD